MRAALRWSLLALTLTSQVALAQNLPERWPDKPVRIIVGTPAGGPVDLLARLLGEQVAKATQQPVVIDNKPGGTGAIASSQLKQQPPDGYSLMLAPNAAFTLVPVIRKMPYRPIEDFSFVGQFAFTPNVFVVPAASPAKTMAELVALAKAQPGALNYGTMLGIPQHLDFERFKHEAGVNFTPVPYTGGSPIVTALVADQIQATLMAVPLVAEWVKGGKLRALALPGPKRVASMPDVPTLAEAGLPHIRLDAGQSFSLAGPAGMPVALLAKIQRAFADAVNDPETRKKLETAGFEISLRDGAALKADLVRDLAATESLIKTLNFKLAD